MPNIYAHSVAMTSITACELIANEFKALTFYFHSCVPFSIFWQAPDEIKRLRRDLNPTGMTKPSTQLSLRVQLWHWISI